jgi:glycosyltransferase involved in cell wall biosynthesis
MRIAIATDAWHPQVNGVVRTLSMTVNHLVARGHDVELITPQQFLTMPMPGYREIRLAVAPRFGARKALNEFAPDIVHIATEGPIGWSARGWCLKHGRAFTTAFHTRFPDYASVRTGLSAERFWPIMQRFHAPSRAVLAATSGLMAELNGRRIGPTRLWSRGVDLELFHRDGAVDTVLASLSKPIFLSVGRVAKEKNLEAFLESTAPGSKVVVGDGPMLADLKARYPQVHFTGALQGEALAAAYRAADVFVFPSKTDTFGLVMVEALACGVPVAGFPVPGPLDVVGNRNAIGCLDKDLSTAMREALNCDRAMAETYGASFSWEKCTDQFEAALAEACVKDQLAIA